MLVRRAFKIITPIIFALSCVSANAAGTTPEDVVKMRQGFMQLQKKQRAILSAALKGDVPYDEDTVQRAKNLAALARIIPDIFVPGTGKDVVEHSNALPKIWQDTEDFKNRIKTLQKETSHLEEIVGNFDKDALEAQMKRVSNACVGCHDNFRYKKPEN